MDNAIIIFSYNRPNHLLKLLNSLKKNSFQNNQKIYFFCDGPKNKGDLIKIKKIKSIIHNSDLKIVKKIYRKKNIGLSQNIIKGISSVLKISNSCIVIEDDLILNSSTIKYMNKMLEVFKNDNKIGSISAYSYLHNFKDFKNKKFYITKRHCSWCWGTWSRVWNKLNWDKINYDQHFSSNEEVKKFSNGGNDLNLLLWGQHKGLIDSWAIRFNYFSYKYKYLSIHPRYSMVLNDGQDMSGTHEKFKFKKKINFDFHPVLKSKKDILKSAIKSEYIDKYIKSTHRRSIKLSLRFFLKNKKII